MSLNIDFLKYLIYVSSCFMQTQLLCNFLSVIAVYIAFDIWVHLILQELATCDPSYYKWTQYLFLLMHENGLAYKKKVKLSYLLLVFYKIKFSSYNLFMDSSFKCTFIFHYILIVYAYLYRFVENIYMCACTYICICSV